MNADTLSIIGTVIGTVIGTGLALAVLMMRITARLDADRRATDRRATGERPMPADSDRRAHQASMEFRPIAERQARVEGPLDGRAGVAN